ncbi:MAG TPA: Zn-ribbon domain-containing OB-fold protein [Actinomycetota bacterium]|nr:Zn-ribbon domain-containing OB-fold protein [Actinomycetota bacterium]
MPSSKPKVPAIEGWFTMDPDRPRLLGTRCEACGSVFFPKETLRCRNPRCGAPDLTEVELSSRGTVWSYTVNHYPPPPPAVTSPDDGPYAIAAVELEEGLVVLGQVPRGSEAGLALGSSMELVLHTLYEDDDAEYLIWKWRPVTSL